MSTKPMRIALGADHAGFAYKQTLLAHLSQNELKDFGTYSTDSVDYPDFAHPVALAVESGDYDLGILICGSANGVAMAANKHQGIRAAICWTVELAVLARTHNNANVLCLPARFISEADAQAICDAFLHTDFEGGRHANRVHKISC
jgi:ribose 5-phosphate isomerase B